MPTTAPRYHFAPATTWANDPNGLIWHEAVWHLFFQCNPEGTDWGNMSWGHATSPDLVTWTERPIAISRTAEEEAFSGSCVFDADNTSGLGTAENPPLVAIYTSNDVGGPLAPRQAQSLAFSLDAGATWTRHAGNPVLDRGSRDFRDPKVFRYEASWIMVAVEAEQQLVVLYRSDNLVTWHYLSSFGPAGMSAGAWECPDLFELTTDTGESRWVLLVNVNPGAIAGGSGCQYFVGTFDGTTFTSDAAASDTANWLDHGRDCYAVASFADVPDGRRIVLGWMNNWDYARDIPLTGGRGAMTVPRELGLTRLDGRWLVTQHPVRELPPDAVTRLRLADGDVRHVRGALLGYRDGTLFLDRSASEQAACHPLFASTESVAVPHAPTFVELVVVDDAFSVEVFAADGLVSITDLVF